MFGVGSGHKADVTAMWMSERIKTDRMRQKTEERPFRMLKVLLIVLRSGMAHTVHTVVQFVHRMDRMGHPSRPLEQDRFR